MRTILLLLMIGCAKLAFAQETTTVTVHVENISNDKGTLIIGMYTESTFIKAKPEFSDNLTIKNGEADVVFKNVPAGIYGISCYHDENGNHVMDFQANGMPIEEYGISNNPMSYGPPQWSDAKFEVDNHPVEMTIRM